MASTSTGEGRPGSAMSDQEDEESDWDSWDDEDEEEVGPQIKLTIIHIQSPNH